MPYVVDEHLTARPGVQLRPAVHRVSGWTQARVSPAVHRGLPSPWLTVILTLHEPLVVTTHPDPAQPGDSYDALVGGLHTTPATITHAGWQSGMQLAVHPLAARCLLGVPAGELAGRDEHAVDVAGAWVEQVQDRMRGAWGWAQRFTVVQDALTNRMGPTKQQPELQRAWTLLCRGGWTVAEVAGEVGWSARRLHARCRAELGLSPQELLRVARFDRAQRSAAAGVPLVRVAAEQGYTDQAHLTRDFSRFAGLSPSRWLAAESRSVQDTAVPAAPGSGT